MLLRPYQEQMLDEARAHMRAGARRVLLVAPTGSGKRIMAVDAIQTAVSRGKRCCFLVHRQELLDQSVRTLEEAKIRAGVIKAGVKPEPHHLCQVASVQSLARREMQRFDFMFCDEAHHNVATTWERILHQQPEAFILGFTATPQRLDGRGLGSQFDAMVVGPTMRGLIDQGFLADYQLYAPPAPDLSEVHTVAGEYNNSELAAAVDRPRIIGDVVEHYRKYAPHTQAICFAVNILHSKHLAEAFQEAGIRARHADGETPTDMRKMILEDFAAGRFQVLCNVDILGEGLDVAGIETVIGARPTQSLTIALQQWGRGLRVKPSGQSCIILDHAGNVMRHGLPDEDRNWSLEDKKKKRALSDVPVTTCKKCFMVVPAGTAVCPGCGGARLIGADDGAGDGAELFEPVHEAGELVAIDPEEIRATRAAARAMKPLGEFNEMATRLGYPSGWGYRRWLAQARTIEQLVALGAAQGYKRGWAHHVWRGRGRGRQS